MQVDINAKTEEIPATARDYYSARVIRNPSILYGPGVLEFYKGHELLEVVPVITGHLELDPHQYGGITPPVVWEVIEPVHDHEEGNGGYSGEFAKIMPFNTDSFDEEYSKRTYKREGDRFKFHPVRWQKGKSTGCICPVLPFWDIAAREINRGVNHARKEGYSYLIGVEDFPIIRTPS